MSLKRLIQKQIYNVKTNTSLPFGQKVCWRVCNSNDTKQAKSITSSISIVTTGVEYTSIRECSEITAWEKLWHCGSQQIILNGYQQSQPFHATQYKVQNTCHPHPFPIATTICPPHPTPTCPALSSRYILSIEQILFLLVISPHL